MRRLLVTRYRQLLALADDHRFAGQAITASHNDAMYSPLHLVRAFGIFYRFIHDADPAFIYNASVAISRLKLPNWAEPFAGN